MQHRSDIFNRSIANRYLATMPLGVALAAALAVSTLSAGQATGAQAAAGAEPPTSMLLSPSAMPAIGRVDERFLAYNVESVEVTGGNFWAPYTRPGDAPAAPALGPQGTEFATNAFRRREPIDLGNPRLRMLTRALGPSYMRVSGSWANSIYFQDDDRPAGPPPEGYQGVLTRAQWRGVVAFARAVDARILTSFAISPGARNPNGAWNPQKARQLFAYTRAINGRIDAVELANEPNASRTVYPAADFARDQAALRALVANASPGTLIVGPASTGEAGFALIDNPSEQLSTARLLSGTPAPRFDVFSHHFYGAVSARCRALGERRGAPRQVTTSPDDAMTEAWLSRADQGQRFYRSMRDRFAPGAPIWITETAQTACGGDEWSSTYLDTFRFVDQLGRLAKQNASIIFHNTLAASDYALIDEDTWTPRPNYWAALLWRRLMGRTVLDAAPNTGEVHVYAHCLRDRPGGTALVAINLSRTTAAMVNVPVPSQRYTLTADTLRSGTVRLNNRLLAVTAGGRMPTLNSVPTPAGALSLMPASITFLAVPNANNYACR